MTVPIQNNGQPFVSDASIPLALSSPGLGTIVSGLASAKLIVHDNNSIPPEVTIASIQPSTILITTGTGRKKKTRTETVIQLGLTGAIEGPGSLGAYQLFSGKTKKRVTTFSKLVPLAAPVYNPTAMTITLEPVGKLTFKQPLQLRISTGSLTDPYGRPVDGGQNFVATLINGNVTAARTLSQAGRSSHIQRRALRIPTKVADHLNRTRDRGPENRRPLTKKWKDRKKANKSRSINSTFNDVDRLFALYFSVLHFFRVFRAFRG